MDKSDIEDTLKNLNDLVNRMIKRIDGVESLLNKLLNIETYEIIDEWMFYDLITHEVVHKNTDLVAGYKIIIEMKNNESINRLR